MKNIHRIEETAKVQERIDALEYAVECIRGRRDKATCLGNMLAEYKSRRQYLKGAKEHMVHFKGGGWNTCYGRDEEEAFMNACLEFDTPADERAIFGAKDLKVQFVSLSDSNTAKEYMKLFD